MALRYTLKKKDNENDEHTVPAEEFVNLMLSFKRNIDPIKEIPKTEILK